MTDDRSEDKSYENESTRDTTPMVQITLKEYDKLKERSKYITDRDLIGCIDKIVASAVKWYNMTHKKEIQ